MVVTVYPRSKHTFHQRTLKKFTIITCKSLHVVNYCIKWVNTSWTHRIYVIIVCIYIYFVFLFCIRYQYFGPFFLYNIPSHKIFSSSVSVSFSVLFSVAFSCDPTLYIYICCCVPVPIPAAQSWLSRYMVRL